MPDNLSNLVWALARPPIEAGHALVESPPGPSTDDGQLVARVSEAYRGASREHIGSGDGWDGWIGSLKAPIHAALMAGGDAAQQMLRHPERNAHFWGFDAVCQAPAGETEPHETVFRALAETRDWRSSYALWLHDGVINLAEAVGAVRVHYPETEAGLHHRVHGELTDLDAVLDLVEAEIGVPLDFPNPFGGELGLSTKRGIIGFRALGAIYQAWRMRQIVRARPGARIIEIGAGLGRTAYYASRFGLRDYTVIDIPLTGSAQAYFLGRTLGHDSVSLYGEDSARWQVKILPPESLVDLSGRYDLVLNVDSFTELSPSVTSTYWDFASERADCLLSINHEFNPSIVRHLSRAHPKVSFSRHPYWMRRGYVEELFDFR